MLFTTPFDEKRDVGGADSAPASRVGYAARLRPSLVESSRPLVARLVVVPDRYAGVEAQGRECSVVGEVYERNLVGVILIRCLSASARGMRLRLSA